MTDNVYKWADGPSIPLRMVDGVPQCPMCPKPMIEIDEGVWKCSEMVELEEQVRLGLIRALERQIAGTEKP